MRCLSQVGHSQQHQYEIVQMQDLIRLSCRAVWFSTFRALFLARYCLARQLPLPKKHLYRNPMISSGLIHISQMTTPHTSTSSASPVASSICFKSECWVNLYQSVSSIYILSKMLSISGDEWRLTFWTFIFIQSGCTSGSKRRASERASFGLGQYSRMCSARPGR